MKESDLVVFLYCILEFVKYLEVNRIFQNKNKFIFDKRFCNEEENNLLRFYDVRLKDFYRRKMVEFYEGRIDFICVIEMVIIYVKDEIVNQFCIVMVILIQYFYYLRLLLLIFKKILEVLNQVVVIFNLFIFRQKIKCIELERIVRSFLIFFLSVV